MFFERTGDKKPDDIHTWHQDIADHETNAPRMHGHSQFISNMHTHELGISVQLILAADESADFVVQLLGLRELMG